MSDPGSGGLIEVSSVLLAKIGSGVAGSLAALRWLPKESTWADRLASLAGGIAAATILGPAIAEVANASTRIEYAIVFVVGLFGMAVIGELMTAIREVQLATIARDAIRKILRIGG